jgi:ketosteroid isomerase-like protein
MALERCSPDVEFDWSRRLLDASVFRRHAGVRRWYEETKELFEEMYFEETEVVDAGDDVVLVGQVRLRGRGSGVDVSSRGGTVWTVAGGKITRMRFFQTRDEALEAVRDPAGRERRGEP